MRRCVQLLALALVGAASLTSGFAKTKQGPNDVPEALWSHFHTGVNVTRWFCYQGPTLSPDNLQNYFKPADFEILSKLHVTYVRLCISPDYIDHNGTADAAMLHQIDLALARFAQHHIAVIWDLHDNGQLKLDAPGGDNTPFITFWQAIAKHYKGKLEKEIVFELLNEPQFNNGNADVWYTLQENAVRAIRQIDPDRTIMVSPTSWSSIDTLAKMTPLPQTNLIYTCHCYDPFLFTHQGASWVGAPPSDLKQVPFPTDDPAGIEKAIAASDPKEKSTLEWLEKQAYGAQYLQMRMQTAMDWGRTNHVPVVLGEFGSNPPVAPPASRARWFEDMKKAFVATGIPYCLWGYDDGMGLGRTADADGTIHVEEITARSLFGFTKPLP